MLGDGIRIIAAGLNATYAPWLIIAMIADLLGLIWVLSGIIIFIVIKYPNSFNWLTDSIYALKRFPAEMLEGFLNTLIALAGYSYDKNQDIFYSKLNSWQRQFGYCRLYDEEAALSGMILDCEPVYFTYNNKKWLIEFWKGQYGITSGFEIGVYNTDKPEINLPNIFNDTFFESAKDDELLHMSCKLLKNHKIFFEREDTHWWLTGFRLGEFSNPSELIMLISITLKDIEMRDEFVRGLKNIWYLDEEININGRVVSFIYNKPHTTQPYTRAKEIEAVAQWKNKYFCDTFNDLTKSIKYTPKKIFGIRKKQTDIYQKIIDMGKSKRKFEVYKTIKQYLN